MKYCQIIIYYIHVNKYYNKINSFYLNFMLKYNYKKIGCEVMSKTTFILIATTYYFLSIAIIILVLNLIKNYIFKKYEKQLNNLERNKNLIISASILSELNKVEALINNDSLKETYDNWQKRFKIIKDEDVPKITDLLLEVEDKFKENDYKNLDSLMAKVELQIYYVKMKADFLLEEIRQLTQSEEKNRDTVTRLKTKYRTILLKYKNNKEDYKLIENPVELQFDNINKLFSAFEVSMDNNNFTEIGKIVKALDDNIGNLEIIIDEAPSIIIMGKNILPKKEKDILNIKKRMIKEGYQLDYLNIEYNIDESNKKIADIFDRLNVLNVEDSIFELKTMLDYFDGLYHDFEKERVTRKLFEEYSRSLGIKINKLLSTVKELYKSIKDIKYSYDLSEDDVDVIKNIKEELNIAKNTYQQIISMHRNKTFPYSKLAKEMELLNVKITNSEEKLEIALRTLGQLKEDELRAYEQLDEIKDILRKSKNKMNSYKLPIIPKNYYVQLKEANEAIKEMVKELEKKPISIRILNTRVDTARDLVLKLYNTSNEIIKTAAMAELAIVYGNRYRPINNEIDFGLSKAEGMFYKGNFKNALENAINSINIVEPDAYKKLIESYKTEL